MISSQQNLDTTHARLRICLIANQMPDRQRTFEKSHWVSLAKELRELGHEVVAMIWHNGQQETDFELNGIELFTLDREALENGQTFDQALYEKFEHLHSQHPFDVVHSFNRSGLLIAKNRSRFNVAFVADVEATYISRLFVRMSMTRDSALSQLFTAIGVAREFMLSFFRYDRPLLKVSDAVLVATPRQQMVLERFYLYPFKKTHFVPAGMDTLVKPDNWLQSELKAKWGIPNSSKVIMAYSEMTDTREIELLLKAFQKVAIKKPNARLILLGSGPKFKEIEYRMLSFALGSRCIMAGNVSNEEQEEIISQSDIVVGLNSQTASFDPSLLEAMARKKVAIGSEMSPMATLIEDGVNGFLVRPGDIDDLTELILNLLSDEYSLNEIGEKARLRMEGLFHPKVAVNKAVEAYMSTLKERKIFKKAFRLRQKQRNHNNDPSNANTFR